MNEDPFNCKIAMTTSHAPEPEQISPRGLEPDRLIGRKELCRFLGVSYPTVWKWLRAGKFIPAIDCNGIPKWQLSAVRSWVNAQPRRVVKPLSSSRK